MQIEGRVLGFDGQLNLVMNVAEEILVKEKASQALRRILFRGGNICPILNTDVGYKLAVLGALDESEQQSSVFVVPMPCPELAQSLEDQMTAYTKDLQFQRLMLPPPKDERATQPGRRAPLQF